MCRGLCFITGICAFCAGSGFSAQVVDRVIVVINDQVITQREFNRAFLPIKKSYEANLEGEELQNRLEETKKALLEQLINTKLAVSLAKKEKVEIDETGLWKRINKIKSYYSSEDAFLQALAEKGTNLTEFKKEIREQMMAQEIVDREVASGIVIMPAEISEFYDKSSEKMVAPRRVRVRGIMMRKGADSDGARKRIEEVFSKLGKGGDFGELAEKYSEGPYAPKSGDMGFIVRGQLLPEMDEAVFSAEKGKITDIVESGIGYHVFMIDDIEESRSLELEEVSDFLREQLYRKKFEEKLAKWLEAKRKNAYISYK
ncbi:MAG: peptidylprolyl isomerase [Candidatus Omnitrophica bacterium]|nr:peptidylprolyl isomerase [Candidatus Omnitrophota bacterium]